MAGWLVGWWYVVELRHALAAYYRRITARYLVNIYAVVQGRRTYVRTYVIEHRHSCCGVWWSFAG